MCLISQTRGSPEPPKEKETGVPASNKNTGLLKAGQEHSFCASPFLSTTSPEGHWNVSLGVFPEKEGPFDAF